MSTKLRIVVKQRGAKPLYGPRAVRFLYASVRAHIRGLKMPDDWEKLSTKQTLEFLGKYLPEHTKLFIIRERKWTRRCKSLYFRMIKSAIKEEVFEGQDRVWDNDELFNPDPNVIIPPRNAAEVYPNGVQYHVRYANQAGIDIPAPPPINWAPNGGLVGVR